MNDTETINQYSFRHALNSVPVNKYQEARQKIKEVFSITSDMQLNKRIDGEIEPKASKVDEIEKLFWTNYKIKVQWGKDTAE